VPRPVSEEDVAAEIDPLSRAFQPAAHAGGLTVAARR
jgi:hypothetical protein